MLWHLDDAEDNDSTFATQSSQPDPFLLAQAGPMPPLVLPPAHLHVCVVKRLRLMQALHCMQWKKSTPKPWPRLHTLQKGQW